MVADCLGKHKARLFLGEGNFTFTEAFIQKHDEKAGHNEKSSLAHSITSTELVTEFRCSECEVLNRLEALDIKSDDSKPKPPSSCDSCSAIIERIEKLKVKGVNVLLGVDATKLSSSFKGKKFARIHWNCPHDGSSFCDQTLPPIIESFFLECSKLQITTDRVHLSIPQPLSKKDFYQGYIYDLTKGARMAGYTLVKKRKFEKDRYPGYQHKQTTSSTTASVTNQGVREFVFEKIDSKKFEEIKENATDPKKRTLIRPKLENLAKASEKVQTIRSRTFYKTTRFYYDCSSDEDSSDCESQS